MTWRCCRTRRQPHRFVHSLARRGAKLHVRARYGAKPVSAPEANLVPVPLLRLPILEIVLVRRRREISREAFDSTSGLV